MTTDQTDHPTDPVQAVAEALPLPGHSIHSWRCEYNPEPCTCVEELAAEIIAAARPAIEREAKAAAWDEGFTRGFYDVLAGGDRDASESAAENPYRIEREGQA